MKKLAFILLVLPCLLYGQEIHGPAKYFLPVPVESSEGRPIKNATVELYIANTDTLQQTLIWLDAGWYYYYGGNESVPSGNYDVYVNGVLWRTNIAVGQADNDFVIAVLSDTANTLRTQWRADINDSLATIYEPDGVTITGSKDDGLVVNGAYLAGNGLGSNIAEQLHVKVKGAISISSDSLRITASGIDSTMIGTGAIKASEIATGAVTTTEILDGTIAQADLGSGIVGSTEIIDNSIQSSDFEDETKVYHITYLASFLHLDYNFEGAVMLSFVHATEDDTVYFACPLPSKRLSTTVTLDSVLFNCFAEGNEKFTHFRIYRNNYGAGTAIFSNETTYEFAGGGEVARYGVGETIYSGEGLYLQIAIDLDYNLYIYDITFKYTSD